MNPREKFLKALKEYCKSQNITNELEEDNWEGTLDNIDEILSCMNEE